MIYQFNIKSSIINICINTKNSYIYPDKRKRNENAFHLRKPFHANFNDVAIIHFRKRIMDFRTKVEELVHGFLATREDLYLVDLKSHTSSDVTVILDGDESLTLQTV